MQRLEEGTQGAAKPSLLNSGLSAETGEASILASLEQGKVRAAPKVSPAKRRMRYTAYGATACITVIVAGWLFLADVRDPHVASSQMAADSGPWVGIAASTPVPEGTIINPSVPSTPPQAEAATIIADVTPPQAAGMASVIAGAAIAGSPPEADTQHSLSARLKEGLAPQSLNVGITPETTPSKIPPQSTLAANSTRSEKRKEERKSHDDKRANASVNAKAKSQKKAPVDGDVVLLSALVAHTADPAATKAAPQKNVAANAKGRPANTSKREELAKAGNGSANLDIVERNRGDTTEGLLQRCKKLGLFEGELCRLRICSGQWESDPACRIE